MRRPAIRPCAGTCGRMTRHNKVPAEQAPGATVRVDGDLCNSCATAARGMARRPLNFDGSTAEVTLHLKVCGGTCGRVTRPSWMKLAEAPGTTQRKTTTHCWSCLNGGTPRQPKLGPEPRPKPKAEKPVDEVKLAQTLTAYESFLAARNARLEQRSRRRSA